MRVNAEHAALSGLRKQAPKFTATLQLDMWAKVLEKRELSRAGDRQYLWRFTVDPQIKAKLHNGCTAEM